MTRVRWPVLGVVLLAFWTAWSALAEVRDGEPETIRPPLHILDDPGRKLSFEEVIEPRFQAGFVLSERAIPNLRLSEGIKWVRFTLTNKRHLPAKRVIFIDWASIERIDLYFNSGGVGWRWVPWNQRLLLGGVSFRSLKPAFMVELPARSEMTCLLRVAGQKIIHLPLTIMPPSRFAERLDRERLLTGIFYGALLAIILYNLVLALLLADLGHLLLVAFLCSFTSFLAIMDGFGREVLWPERPDWDSLIVFLISGLTQISGALFCRAALTTKRLAPRLDRLLLLAAAIGMVVAGLGPVDLQTANLLAGFNGLFATLLLIWSSLTLSIRGHRPARLFLAAWLIFMLGAISFVLTIPGLIEYPPLTELWLKGGFFLGAIILSLALADRFALAGKGRERQLRAEIREATAELERERSILDAVNRNMDQGSVLIDAEGRLIAANRRFSEMTGYRPGEFGPEPLFEDVIPALGLRLKRPQGSAEHSLEVLRRNEPAVFELRLRPEMVVEVRHNPLDQGGFVRTYTDITERKRFEEELREARDEAQRASRSKTDFLANMSHEIRTPLNAIIGLAEVLAETELDPDQRRYVEVFHSSGENLLAIINDLLDLSKVEAGRLSLDRTAFDLAAMIEEIRRSLAHQADLKGLDLEVLISPETPLELIGDPARLRQIIVNLLGNAIKFTTQGRVGLTVGPDPEPTSDRPDGVGLRFEVSDTGPGISEAAREKIFDRFTQADSSTTKEYPGTGLGLAICASLVELLSGRIWVENRSEKGSRFIFTAVFEAAPAAGPDDRARVSAASPAIVRESAPDRPVRVLVVDDSPHNRFLVEAYLKDQPIDLVQAGDGREALDRLATEVFDLILMDIQMPHLDGYEATRLVRALEVEADRPPTPVIAMTAYALEADRQRSLRAGCNAHLAKPIRKQELLAAIRKYTSLAETPTGRRADPQPAIDPALIPVIPEFLALIRESLDRVRTEIRDGDLGPAKVLGHQLKGEGRAYGFEPISKMGRELEKAAQAGEKAQSEQLLQDLRAYLGELAERF